MHLATADCFQRCFLCLRMARILSTIDDVDFWMDNFLWSRGRSEKATINLDVHDGISRKTVTKILVDSSLTECCSKFNPLQSEFTFSREISIISKISLNFTLAWRWGPGTAPQEAASRSSLNCWSWSNELLSTDATDFYNFYAGSVGKKIFFTSFPSHSNAQMSSLLLPFSRDV